jgi:hypothetical protein
MQNLESFQRTVARALTALAIVHVSILAAIAWWLGKGTIVNLASASALAAVEKAGGKVELPPQPAAEAA